MSSTLRPALVAAFLLASATAFAADAPPADDWSLSITPYLLLPGVDAELGVDGSGGSPVVDSGPTDILALINFAAMFKVEARQGRAFVIVDWMYVDLGDADTRVRQIDFPDGTVPIGVGVVSDTAASFDGYMVALAGGYRVYDEGRGQLDVYGGLRTLNLSASFRWSFTTTVTSPGGSYTFPQVGEIEDSDETWDAVLGMRGNWRFGDHWRAFGVGDRGWGHDTESWQWGLGVSYELKAASLELAWREIGWSGLGDSGPGELKLYGPAFGATFRF